VPRWRLSENSRPQVSSPAFHIKIYRLNSSFDCGIIRTNRLWRTPSLTNLIQVGIFSLSNVCGPETPTLYSPNWMNIWR
jgi:hypothetical protein